MNFVVIGPRGNDTATQRSVYGEIVDGRVANACYLNGVRPDGFSGRVVNHLLRKAWMPFRLKCLLTVPWEVSFRKIAPHLRADDSNCVLFTPSTHPFERIPRRLIHQLRRRAPKCRLAYYFIDGVERTAMVNHCDIRAVTDFVRQFDAVFTYDPNDAEKYGYGYIDIPIWHSDRDDGEMPLYDVYFCGRDKAREALLTSVASRLADSGLSSKFVIVGETGKDYAASPLPPQPWRPYPEVVAEMQRARCILEVLAATNSGATLRYKEAVMYNKKLLTNNPDLARLPYYDARFMKYFETAADIDLEWLRRKEPVEYGYRGDFSAACFLKRIEAAL